MNTKNIKLAVVALASVAFAACAGKQLRFEQTSGEYIVPVPAASAVSRVELRAQDSLTTTGNLDLAPILAAEGKKSVSRFVWIAHKGVFMLAAEGFANVWLLSPASDGVHASYKPVAQAAPLLDPAFTNDDVPGQAGVKLFSGPEGKRHAVIITRDGRLLNADGSVPKAAR